MRQTVEVEFDFNDKPYTAQVDIFYVHDDDWGADADGNRGAKRLLIYDSKPLHVVDQETMEALDVDNLPDGMMDIITLKAEEQPLEV